MKTLNTIVKVLTALATVAGAVYIIATYGDKIVAWAKAAIAKCPVILDTEAPIYTTTTVRKEAEAETPAAAEVPTEEENVAPVEENVPVADEADFEG